MKTSIKTFFLLPGLVVALGLIPAGRVAAQTFTFGPERQTTNTASITCDFGAEYRLVREQMLGELDTVKKYAR